MCTKCIFVAFFLVRRGRVWPHVSGVCLAQQNAADSLCVISRRDSGRFSGEILLHKIFPIYRSWWTLLNPVNASASRKTMPTRNWVATAAKLQKVDQLDRLAFWLLSIDKSFIKKLYKIFGVFSRTSAQDDTLWCFKFMYPNYVSKFMYLNLFMPKFMHQINVASLSSPCFWDCSTRQSSNAYRRPLI